MRDWNYLKSNDWTLKLLKTKTPPERRKERWNLMKGKPLSMPEPGCGQVLLFQYTDEVGDTQVFQSSEIVSIEFFALPRIIFRTLNSEYELT